jgi:F420-non-reducing hydrogenase iron-sulfur subunit
MQYPPNLRIIRVACSGMIDPEIVVHALSKGIDGVLGIGCRLGECHYLEGNEKAKAREEAIRIVLATGGIDPDRFRMEWLSSAEAARFVEVVTNFVGAIRALGPNPLRRREASPDYFEVNSHGR